MHKYALLLTFLISFICQSQTPFLAKNIPENLKKNANSVVINKKVDVDISSYKNMTLKYHEVITVLDKLGVNDVNLTIPFDKNRRIKNIEVLVFDHKGERIERFKKKDFLDISAVEGSTLYSDSRKYYMKFLVDRYPYTVEINYDLETSNTASIIGWYPIGNYKSSVVESSYHVTYSPELNLRYKLFNDMSIIEVDQSPGSLTFKVSNVEPIEAESQSPSFDEFMPHVMFSMDEFYLEGIKGFGKNWKEFGQWMYENLLKENLDLPESAKKEIEELVGDETQILAKARKVYQYMQERTRYISVQVGIGGWKPMPASFVDDQGYGDCKALTIYTKALMDAAGIPSYYSLAYAGSNKESIDPDIASLQGNHVFLTLVDGEEKYWLECTSQKTPFGFIGDFTDDRKVLMITPEGGELVHTKEYTQQENTLITKGNCTLNTDGTLIADVTMLSEGVQYGDRFEAADLTLEKQKDIYKEYWDFIDNLNFNSIEFNDDQTNVKLTERINFTASSYASFIENNMIVPINMLNRLSHVPKKYKDRKRKLKINHAFNDEDECIISLPEGYELLNLPESISFETDFGYYSSSVEMLSDDTIKYNRQLKLKNGIFPKEEYKKFRSFMKKVSRHDNQKIILNKK